MNNKNSSSLSRKHVIQSSMWIFGGQFVAQFLRLVNNLVMTRLLVPEMFGVMTVANTLIVGLSLCTYIGLEHNVIQSPRGDDPDFLDSAWTVQVIRGVLLWLIALVISLGLFIANQAGVVPIDSVYADENLPAVLGALSFLALIGGFESMKKATASRHMLVEKLIKIELVCQVIGLVTMIVYALFHKSIWALVAGTMTGSIAHVIATYIALPGPSNKLFWDKETISDLFHFGKWILLTTIMGFFVKNSDKLILGALITPQLLGVYSIAVFMTAALIEVISKWAGAVALPVLSKYHREDKEGLQKAYYKFGFIFDSATLFASGVLFNAGYLVIEVLYDSRYSPAGAMIQILSLALIGSRTILAEQCYVAMGKPKMSVPMNVLQLIVIFTGVVPAYHYFGMDGALYVIACTILLTLPLTWYLLNRIGILNWKRELVTLPAFFVGYGFSKLLVIAYEHVKVLYFN